jgi:hypothetical protein
VIRVIIDSFCLVSLFVDAYADVLVCLSSSFCMHVCRVRTCDTSALFGADAAVAT